MALATLSVDLVAKLAALEAGMDKAGRLAERQAQQIERAFSGLKSVAGGVGAALAGAFSVGAVVAFARATIDGVDALNDLADATGSSVENISALEDVAARAGTQVEVVGSALIKLNQALAGAKPGSDIERALQAIGLNAEELRRLDPAEAFQRIAVALARFADDGNKARLTQELFGKSLREVASLLKDVAEAGRLNGTVTNEQARAAEALNKQLAAFEKNATDAARAVLRRLLPALNAAIERYRALDQFGGTAAGIVAIGREGRAFVDAADGVAFYAAQLRDLQAQRAIIAADPNPVARRGGLLDIDAEIAKIRQFEQYYRRVFSATAPDLGQADPRELARRGRGTAALPSLPDLAGSGSGGRGGAQRPGASARELPAAPLDPATQAALRAMEQTDAAKIREINAALDALFARRASGLGSDAETEEAIQRLRDELARLSPEAQRASEQAQRLQAILAQTPQGQLGGVVADVELLNRAFEAGQVGVEQWADAIRTVTARLPEESKAKIEEIDEFSRQASRNIQDALGDTLEAALSGNFASIGRLWASTLQRMVAQAAAAQLNRVLFGDLFSGGTSTGLIGELFKSFGFGGGAPAGRAAGGPVAAGTTYLVGERGPELLRMGPQGGRVIPGTAAAGLSVAMPLTVHIDARSDQGQIAQLVAGAVARGRESLLLELRARGVV